MTSNKVDRKNPHGCTGPKTPAGKARMARNPVRHGGYSAASEALPFLGESPEDFTRLTADLVEALRPAGPLEARLVNKMASLWWRMERAGRAEREGLKAALDDARYMNGEARLMFPRSSALEDVLPEPAPVRGTIVNSKWQRNLLTFLLVTGPGLIVMVADNGTGCIVG